MSVKEFESIYNENGIKDGTIKRYHVTETLKSETIYRDGKKNGIKKKYNLYGEIREEIPYIENKIHGIRIYYHDGYINKTINYENNEKQFRCKFSRVRIK
jgi:antitoxin component YwqK of YwqJK toxin-antitoxin module